MKSNPSVQVSLSQDAENVQSSAVTPIPEALCLDDTNRTHTNAGIKNKVRPCVTRLTVRITSVGCSRSATTPGGGSAAAATAMVNRSAAARALDVASHILVLRKAVWF